MNLRETMQADMDKELYEKHKALVQFATNKKVKKQGAPLASKILADQYGISKAKVVAAVRRVREARRKEICDLYAVQKKTITEIAKLMECNATLVLRILKEEDLHVPDDKNKTHLYRSAKAREDLIEMIRSGAGIKEIASCTVLSKLQVLEAIRFHFKVKGIERAREVIKKEDAK